MFLAELRFDAPTSLALLTSIKERKLAGVEAAPEAAPAFVFGALPPAFFAAAV